MSRFIKSGRNILRRAAALLIALCMAVPLAACGGDKADKTARDLKLEEQRTVRVWYCDERYTDYINFVAERFHAANELVTIEPVLVDAENYLEYIYDESIRKNNAADVYLMLSDDLEKACMMGLTVENSTYSSNYTEKNYSRAAIEAAKYKGRLYGYPISFNVPFMVYNKNVAYAVDTFLQLSDYCSNYQVTQENENIIQLVSWDVSDMLVNFGFSCSSVSIGGDTGDDSNIVSADRELLKRAVEEFVKFRDEFGIVRSESTLDSCTQMFADGQLAYTITDVEHLRTIDESGISYGVCEIPQIADGLEISGISENMCAFVNPYSSSIEVAKAVANAMSYDYASAINSTIGLMSSRTIQIENNDYEESHGKIYEIYSESNTKAKFMGASYFYTRFEIMLHQIWDGENSDTAINAFMSELKPQDG